MERKMADEGKEPKDGIIQARRNILQRMEAKRGSKVITIVHSKSVFGEESYEELGPEEVEHILMRIHDIPNLTPIDLILHTPGGMALSAEMIAMALMAHRGKVTVHIPFYAMSGGTLIALAGNEIRMEQWSVLGPVDPQIGGWPASILLKIVKEKGIQFSQDDTIMYSYLAEMALEQMKRFVLKILSGKMRTGDAERVADCLLQGYVAHDTPINYKVAKSLRLPVKLGVPEEVYQFFDTCRFGICARPMLVDYGKATPPRLKSG